MASEAGHTVGGQYQAENQHPRVGLILAKEDNRVIGVHYQSAIEMDWKVLAIYPEPPSSIRGGLIYPIRNGKWMATLIGINGEVLPLT